jgi:hypothetical protein
LVEVAESLVQDVVIVDEADNLVLIVLSVFAKLKPTKFTVELPLEVMLNPNTTDAGKGA